MPATPQASRIASWLLQRCLGPASGRRRLARQLRKYLLRSWAPAFQAEYFGARLLFPGQHDLAILSNDLPLFNTPLRRLAQAVRNHETTLRLLDIGANIGDGLPLVDPQPTDQFWLVEGSSEFLPYLRANSATSPNVTIIPSYLGDQHSVAQGAEVVIAGNAHILAGAAGELVFETLDRLFPGSSPTLPNLLKIDVEGHEARIFAGGADLLRRVQPPVFMEWYPSLLLREGENELASLDRLLAAGYTDAVIYDNLGFLVGTFALAERAHLQQFAHYAQMRDLFYFDLAVFAPKHSRLREDFCASETAFYADWLRGRSG